MNKKLCGGITKFDDIVSLQVKCSSYDLQTLFMTMEVWGQQRSDGHRAPISLSSLQSKKSESLRTQRSRSLVSLTDLTQEIIAVKDDLESINQE